jgi:hypothetical protein
MPALRNQKHENFSQLTLQGAKYGWTQAEIYKRAGYRATGHSAEMAASRLMKKDEIRTRIAELGAPAVKKTAVSVQSLLDELRAAYEGAMSAEQFAAATSAAMSRAKLAGLLVDQIEVGAPGSFAACETVTDVATALLIDQSPAEALATLALLQQEIEQHAADHADIVVTEPARPRAPGSEVDKALALYWPKRSSRR